MLDLLHWLNYTFKDAADQINKKEFHNDPVNNNLDLRSFVDQWVARTRAQVAQGVPMSADQNNFNPTDYQFLMTPHMKTLMLQRFNRHEH